MAEETGRTNPNAWANTARDWANTEGRKENPMRSWSARRAIQEQILDMLEPEEEDELALFRKLAFDDHMDLAVAIMEHDLQMDLFGGFVAYL